HTDLSLEPRTVNWAENHFLRVMTVDSGKRWRLIVAQGLRTAPPGGPEVTQQKEQPDSANNGPLA
ncbi:MAG: hypothetical protein OEU78_12605, partial [Gammaproteobacteria bacterium]|nr:hypothetical protein [Gammaproteobacteria bacterium]